MFIINQKIYEYAELKLIIYFECVRFANYLNRGCYNCVWIVFLVRAITHLQGTNN